MTASYGYDVFGAIRTQSGTGDTMFKFTGEQLDSDSSLYYLRARYYDPEIGRFLGRDQFLGFRTDPRTLNPYVYVLNDPVNLIDPYGLIFHNKTWDCVKKPIDCAENVGEELGGAALDAGEFWGEQYVNNWLAYRDYVDAVYHSPTSYPQETLGLWVAWGSFGSRRRIDGATFYENCFGICSWQRLTSYSGWSVGHNVFLQGTTSCRNVAHELTHVRQSEREGVFWLPKYFWQSRHGYDKNPYEIEAFAAQQEQCRPKE